MKKLTFIMLVVTAAFFFGLGGFSKPLLADTADVNQTNRGVYLNIMATTKSQYYMLNALTDGKHNIEYMFNNPKIQEDYKVTEDAINNVSNMDLFFYTGNENEAWINNFLNKLNKSRVGVIELSRGIRIKYYKDDGNRVVNPYFWTGPNEYEIMLYNAKSALQEKDPANRNFYEENYNKVINEVTKITTNFSKIQEKAKTEPIFLTRSNEFEYLLSDLGINYTVVDSNTTFKEYIKENNLKAKNVYIIKDKENKEDLDGLNSVTLQKENLNESYVSLIQENVNELIKAYQ